MDELKDALEQIKALATELDNARLRIQQLTAKAERDETAVLKCSSEALDAHRSRERMHRRVQYLEGAFSKLQAKYDLQHQRDDEGFLGNLSRFVNELWEGRNRVPLAECNGICLSGTDVGVPGADIAYAHPDCELHSGPSPFDFEVLLRNVADVVRERIARRFGGDGDAVRAVDINSLVDLPWSSTESYVALQIHNAVAAYKKLWAVHFEKKFADEVEALRVAEMVRVDDLADDLRKDAEEAQAELVKTQGHLHWAVQTLHQAYHPDIPGTWRECPRDICASSLRLETEGTTRFPDFLELHKAIAYQAAYESVYSIYGDAIRAKQVADAVQDMMQAESTRLTTQKAVAT